MWLLFSHPIPAKSHADEIVSTSTITSDVIALKAPKSVVLETPGLISTSDTTLVKSSYTGYASTTLERISYCESGDNPLARNPKSTAKGKYQFLDSTWLHYAMLDWGTIVGKSVFSATDSEELAEYVYKNYGTSDWNESKRCWS